jgi:hypothetical protein
VASGVELDEPAAAGVAVGVAVTSFDDVQPHVPTTNAAKMVTHTANVNGFIFSAPETKQICKIVSMRLKLIGRLMDF